MNKLIILLISLICVICIISAGCGAGNMEMRHLGSTGFDTELDPFDFGDEFLHRTVNNLETDTGDNSDVNNFNTQTDSSLLSTNNENISPPEDSTQVTENISAVKYRAQIGFFNSRANADKLAESARSKMNYPVYVEYISPFYRVRVGDFILKSDAEECVKFLKEKGFRDSRWIPTNINSQ